MQSFSAGACTWPKILLRLQVWNLFAIGEQIMRVADCKFCQKRALPFLGKRLAVCRAHNLSADGGQIPHLQTEKYFLPGTRPGKK